MEKSKYPKSIRAPEVFGYARVSTKEQNLDRQMIALEPFGIEECGRLGLLDVYTLDSGFVDDDRLYFEARGYDSEGLGVGVQWTVHLDIDTFNASWGFTYEDEDDHDYAVYLVFYIRTDWIKDEDGWGVNMWAATDTDEALARFLQGFASIGEFHQFILDHEENGEDGNDLWNPLVLD